MENIMAILVTLCLMGAVTGVNPSGKLKDLQHEIFFSDTFLRKCGNFILNIFKFC
jgi:hypothetical protein